MCVVKLTKVVFLICRCFFLFVARFFFGCVVSICCQNGRYTFLFERKDPKRGFFLFVARFFFGCVVSICSVCVVKLTKVVFLICRCFFLFAARFFFGCVVSICSVCVVKITKVFA